MKTKEEGRYIGGVHDKSAPTEIMFLLLAAIIDPLLRSHHLDQKAIKHTRKDEPGV
jgi:hypothetical protein